MVQGLLKKGDRVRYTAGVTGVPGTIVALCFPRVDVQMYEVDFDYGSSALIYETHLQWNDKS